MYLHIYRWRLITTHYGFPLPQVIIQSYGLFVLSTGHREYSEACSTTGCVFGLGWRYNIAFLDWHFHSSPTRYPARVSCSSLISICSYLSVNISPHVLTSRNGKHVLPCQKQPRNSYTVCLCAEPFHIQLLESWQSLIAPVSIVHYSVSIRLFPINQPHQSLIVIDSASITACVRPMNLASKNFRGTLLHADAIV